MMKASLCTRYGGTEALDVCQTARPARQPGELLIRVHASSINPVDWKILRGDLRILFGRRPPPILGGDFAGVVLEADASSRFQPGDRVWGLTEIRKLRRTPGAHAEITRCASKLVDAMPERLSFEEAASVPLVGLTAYQSLVHHAHLQPGQRVLINGCSGGVGLIAVQLARALGASVVGVCSATNRSVALQAGCDEVIDYQEHNLLDEDLKVDVWFDVVGNQSLGAVRHQLAPAGCYLNIVKLISTSISSWFNPIRGQKSHAVFVSPSASDLAHLRELIQQGDLHPVIERIYPLDQIADAYKRSRSKRTVGKLVISMPDSLVPL
ncbi:MAG: NAD(P)-dependent alcohol dehydrogenase [Myxococcota bacterium]|nr:NAD(P)-dependent alcohol dehydrogenase [Myxococcota bacterium]